MSENGRVSPNVKTESSVDPRQPQAKRPVLADSAEVPEAKRAKVTEPAAPAATATTAKETASTAPNPDNTGVQGPGAANSSSKGTPPCPEATPTTTASTNASTEVNSVKVEPGDNTTTGVTQAQEASRMSAVAPPVAAAGAVAAEAATKTVTEETKAPEGSQGTSSTTTTSAGTSATAPQPAPAPAQSSTTSPTPAAAPSSSTSSEAPPPPLKALKMSHLRTKYTGELEYMLREFRKLERQLLGAKGATQIEESAGSRERREKLHSFILHLEDTIRQIELGCKLEAEGKSTVNVGVGGPEAAAAAAAANSSNPDTLAQEQAKKQQRADSVGLANLTQEKEEEENVQKLEEHILANLLPVKVRLKKQLAAQQGATRNPAGMPASRRGMLQPSEADRGKGTFAAAAEQKRKEAEALAAAQQQQNLPPAEPVAPDKTHFGKPLGRRGSSLTQKLHGETLGSQGRKHGHGVGLAKPAAVSEADPKVIYGGVAPGSQQVVSGVAVAQQVHKEMVIDSPHLKNKVDTHLAKPPAVPPLPTTTGQPSTASKVSSAAVPCPAPTSIPQTTKKPASQQAPQVVPGSAASPPKTPSHPNAPKSVPPPPGMAPSVTAQAMRKKLEDPTISDEERKKLRRKLKKKLMLRRARRREYERQRQVAMQQSAPTPGASSKAMVGGRKKVAGGKMNGKKRGPRSVEYICALCSEAYSSVCEFNPWWALAQHECPKCRKNQIPRVDISAPANAIEYHPALLAHADDNGASAAAAAAAAAESAANAAQVNQVPSASKYQLNSIPGDMLYGSDSEFGSDLSDITDGNLSDVSLDSNDSDADVLASMTPAEKAEHEKFGFEYKGPKLSDSEAARMLILMLHANGCPCRHKSAQHRDVCRSTKFMMLHVRDCPGTTSTFDVCPFPWCRKVKHLLYHLVSCEQPDDCAICSPTNLSSGMQSLVGLNGHRLKRQRERMIAAYKAGIAKRQPQAISPVQSGAKPAASPSPKKPTAQRVPSSAAASSKPKASASRSKAKGTAPPSGRATKATKPAANAARQQVADPTRVSPVAQSSSNQPSAPVNPIPNAPAAVSTPALSTTATSGTSKQAPVAPHVGPAAAATVIPSPSTSTTPAATPQAAIASTATSQQQPNVPAPAALPQATHPVITIPAPASSTTNSVPVASSTLSQPAVAVKGPAQQQPGSLPGPQAPPSAARTPKEAPKSTTTAVVQSTAATLPAALPPTSQEKLLQQSAVAASPATLISKAHAPEAAAKSTPGTGAPTTTNSTVTATPASNAAPTAPNVAVATAACAASLPVPGAAGSSPQQACLPSTGTTPATTSPTLAAKPGRAPGNETSLPAQEVATGMQQATDISQSAPSVPAVAPAAPIETPATSTALANPAQNQTTLTSVPVASTAGTQPAPATAGASTTSIPPPKTQQALPVLDVSKQPPVAPAVKLECAVPGASHSPALEKAESAASKEVVNSQKGSAVIAGSVVKVDATADGNVPGIDGTAQSAKKSSGSATPSEKAASPPAENHVAKVEPEDNDVPGAAKEESKASVNIPAATVASRQEEQQASSSTSTLGPSCSKEDITKSATEPPIKSC